VSSLIFENDENALPFTTFYNKEGFNVNSRSSLLKRQQLAEGWSTPQQLLHSPLVWSETELLSY